MGGPISLHLPQDKSKSHKVKEMFVQQVPVDQAHMDEMCLKVKELKIRRKSSSKESLLDTQRFNQKRGSTETLHTFNERIGDEEEDENRKKTKYMKKLKQEWIARSLTTLAPR